MHPPSLEPIAPVRKPAAEDLLGVGLPRRSGVSRFPGVAVKSATRGPHSALLAARMSLETLAFDPRCRQDRVARPGCTVRYRDAALTAEDTGVHA